MKRTVILDAGHGGMRNGKYPTPGKRSPNWQHGVLYEGASNRWIMYRVMELLDTWGIPYYCITPGDDDTGLTRRANLANNIYNQNSGAYLLSIHSNAGGGTGFEAFTSRGETTSDRIAELFLDTLAKDFPNERHRYDLFDGDKDKEAGYTILTKTNCPAVLVELLFMDNRADYKKLWDPTFRGYMAMSLATSIKYLYEGKVH
jgi:N-acetylmuramoyl-L-alanine amidase